MRPVPTDPAALKTWVANLSRDELKVLTQQVSSGALTGGLGLLGDLAPGNREFDLATPPDEPSLFTLTLELRGSTPRIWRRLDLPGDLTLDVVHTLFQAVMGWTDSHLHRFQPGDGQSYNQPYFVTEFDEDEGDEGTREDGVRLDQVLRTPGDRLTYLYDFGDGWEHRVTLDSVVPLTPGNREPVCLGGARACPPEDVGGIHGYQEIAAWLRTGAPANDVPEPFEDADHAHGWLPVDYDADAFDAAEATAAMQLWVRGEHRPWHGVPEPLANLVQGLRGQGWVDATAWLTALGPRAAVGLDEEDVRRAGRPWLAVLDAVGAGTKLTTAGYLPPGVVAQIAQSTGMTDWWIGKANREDLTWPVAALRENAQHLGLLRKAKGTLAPTARARAVRGHPRELVATVLQRLPLGKGFAADAGWLLLLGLAAGDGGAALDERVAQMLTERGWRTHGSSGVSASDARRGSRVTLGALESMAGGHRAVDAALLTRLARATLLGVTNNQ
ncbi:plasmid pRiA4b ORF-3 family protein [Knoellia sinensis]|nr:plasmid pRiA4b ORF-3 family protein [Knoellia sinensis]